MPNDIPFEAVGDRELSHRATLRNIPGSTPASVAALESTCLLDKTNGALGGKVLSASPVMPSTSAIDNAIAIVFMVTPSVERSLDRWSDWLCGEESCDNTQHTDRKQKCAHAWVSLNERENTNSKYDYIKIDGFTVVPGFCLHAISIALTVEVHIDKWG